MFSLRSITKLPIRKGLMPRRYTTEDRSYMLFRQYEKDMNNRFADAMTNMNLIVAMLKDSPNKSIELLKESPDNQLGMIRWSRGIIVAIGGAGLAGLYMAFEKVDKQFEKVDKRFETLETDVRDIKTMIIEMINKT